MNPFRYGCVVAGENYCRSLRTLVAFTSTMRTAQTNLPRKKSDYFWLFLGLRKMIAGWAP